MTPGAPTPSILKFKMPVKSERATTAELKRLVNEAGAILVRYQAGPERQGWLVAPKKSILDRLGEVPAGAIHFYERDGDRIVLG